MEVLPDKTARDYADEGMIDQLYRIMESDYRVFLMIRDEKDPLVYFDDFAPARLEQLIENQVIPHRKLEKEDMEQLCIIIRNREELNRLLEAEKMKAMIERVESLEQKD